jgi:hypothetical protein
MNLRQCGVLVSRLRESARKECVTAVGPNPPRELTVKEVARRSGGSRGRTAACYISAATVNQAARYLSRRSPVI